MTEWIKCSDRLPNPGEVVLIYGKNHNDYYEMGNYFIAEKLNSVETPWNFTNDTYPNSSKWTAFEAIAWMHLPEWSKDG